MSIKSTIAIIASLVTCCSVSAMAEDKPFSGPYIGVEGSAETTVGTGTIGGVVGFRQQTDSNIVFGAEGSFSKYIEAETSAGRDFSYLDYKNEWSATGLVGFAFGSSNQNLLFARAGYLKQKYDVIDDDTGDVISNRNEGGIRVGGGYERMISSVVSLRLAADYVKPDGLDRVKVTAALLMNF